MSLVWGNTFRFGLHRANASLASRCGTRYSLRVSTRVRRSRPRPGGHTILGSWLAGSRPARGSAEHRAADVGGARTGEREAGVNYTRRARFFAALVPILAALVASLQGCAATPAAKADGEPIPLHSTDPRFSGYFSQVRKMIHEKWAYPCVQNATTGECEYKAASLTIEFTLLQDGRVTDVRVTKTAEWQVYDDVAAQALRMAAPFPPV